jgi:hypothetical protein
MALAPYEQGELDGLCGIYASVNAIRLIDKTMHGQKSVTLFNKLLRCLEKRGGLSSVATNGMYLRDLNIILNEVVNKRYGIVVERPFCWSRKRPLDHLLSEIETFLEEDSGRAVIASVGGGMYHWSVIARVTRKEIHFFDSYSIKKLKRRYFTTGKVTNKKPYYFDKKDVFFLSKKRT